LNEEENEREFGRCRRLGNLRVDLLVRTHKIAGSNSGARTTIRTHAQKKTRTDDGSDYDARTQISDVENMRKTSHVT
jgi:hypothetical protein